MRVEFTQRADSHARSVRCGTGVQGQNGPPEATEITSAQAPRSGVVPLGLPSAQRAALAAVRDYARTEGRPPTQREVADAVGVASLGNLQKTLARLERRGMLHRRRGEHRSLVVTATGLRALGETVEPTAREGRLERLLARTLTLLPLGPDAPLVVAIRKELEP